MGKKVAIITGSATGVGAATAILLAQKNAMLSSTIHGLRMRHLRQRK